MKRYRDKKRESEGERERAFECGSVIENNKLIRDYIRKRIL